MTNPPLIVHAIHHLIMGGLENGLINLINRMPKNRYRHAILCIDYYSDFNQRLTRDDVQIFAMHRKQGRDPATSWRIWRLFRRIRPAIVHSRNLSGLNALLPAVLAGVRCRIHGEHGWHDGDLDGSNRKYQLLRRLHRPLVNRYVALSGDLHKYLNQKIDIPEQKISQIHNGVDTERFHPEFSIRTPLPGLPTVTAKEQVVIGSIGRFQIVKDQLNLARAFVHLLLEYPKLKGSVILAIVGDGVELNRVRAYLNEAGVAQWCWLPGARNDISSILRSFDVFVLPSKGEGISNTILEAMASGLPVVATNVGGNPELIVDAETGFTVPVSDARALAAAIEIYVRSKTLRHCHGAAGRRRVEQEFSLNVMLDDYLRLYDNVLEQFGNKPID